jgi:hypothetical protein
MTYFLYGEERDGRMGKKPFIGKNYRTCTFEDMGSRKDEFLEKVVQQMEAKGFRRSAPIEPFKPSLELKDAISKSAKSYLLELERYNMVSADIILESDKNEEIALRAKVNDNDLRFGYFFALGLEKMEFSLRWRFIFGYLALLAVMFFIAENFHESLGLWGPLILSLIIAVPLALEVRRVKPSLFIYSQTRRKQKEIDQLVIEVGRSMDSKPLTLFKKTTVELED